RPHFSNPSLHKFGNRSKSGVAETRWQQSLFTGCLIGYPHRVRQPMTNPALQARYPLTQGVNPWLVVVAVMLPTFMEVLDTAIASVALPYIAGSLSATNSEATWVLTSYLVANAVILPASNWFARRFGRKRFLLICVTIFTFFPNRKLQRTGAMAMENISEPSRAKETVHAIGLKRR